MAESDNLLQKAFYLGIGMAGYAVEQASDKFQELRKEVEKLANTADFPQQIQKLADEMVNKGKMNAEEARKFVDEMVKQATSAKINNNSHSDNQNADNKPRTIEIISDEDD